MRPVTPAAPGSVTGRTLLAPGRPIWPRSGLDGLDLEVQLNLVGKHDAAIGHRGVEADVEVTPVDLAGRGKACPVAAIRVRTEAVELQPERHVPGDALERQVAVEHV